MIQTDRSGLSATVFYKASNDLLKLLLGSGAEKQKKFNKLFTPESQSHFFCLLPLSLWSKYEY